MASLEWLVSTYQDPRFVWVALLTPLVGATTFLALALPWTWLAAAEPKWLRPYRIQPKPGNVKRGFWPAMRRYAVNNLALLAGGVILWPMISLSGVHTGALPPWFVIAGQIVFFLLLDDFVFYWLHRGLHTKWLYRHVHSVHHRSTSPFALQGNFMHVVEFGLIAAVAFLGPLLVGAHVVTLWLWIALRQVEAVEGHCGYAPPFSLITLIPRTPGNGFHDAHHRRFNGNYAGLWDHCDRIFGTRLETASPRKPET